MKNTIILNPEWGTSAVYKILDSDLPKHRQGILLEKDLALIWKEEDGFPVHKYETLLRLMSNFELSFRIKDSNDYIIAELLQKNPVDFNWDYKANLQFQYHYSFMPTGIFPRFIVRSHEEIIKNNEGSYLCWKYGVFLQFNDAVAFVLSIPNERRIEIRVKGENKKDLLTIIRKELNYINSQIKKVLITSKVPCPCSPNCKYLFNYDTLIKAQKKKRKYFPCGESIIDVNVSALINGIDVVEEKKLKYLECPRGENIREDHSNGDNVHKTNTIMQEINIYGGENILQSGHNTSANINKSLSDKYLNEILAGMKLLNTEISNLNHIPQKITNKTLRALQDAEEETIDSKPDPDAIAQNLGRVKDILEKSGETYDQAKGWGKRLYDLLILFDKIFPSIGMIDKLF